VFCVLGTATLVAPAVQGYPRVSESGANHRELPIAAVHAAAVRHLPPHHRDPFDRLLIVQARTEPLLLMTDDPLISRYAVPRIQPRNGS
jgi:PIN domain nuclease of toxin-antitoxin system